MFNQNIIDIFKKLRRYYEIKGDTWRIKAYREAIDALEAYNKPINTVNDIPKLPGIGKRSTNKIIKIIEGATLKDFVSKEGIITLKAYEELIRLRDVGPKKAVNFINNFGIRGINDLRKKVQRGEIKLTHSQSIGLKYYDDLIVQIPNKEIQYIERLFKKVAISVDKNLKMLILGSYRRKKPLSNDIDVLLYHPDVKTRKDLKKYNNYLQLFVDKLNSLNIITAELKTGSMLLRGNPKSLNVEYLIKTKYSKFHRKVDIKYYPQDSHITAIVYFTGSRRFNRFMRDKYKRKGYLLNQYGLFKKGKVKKVPIKNEKELFDRIGMKYLLPEQRN